jgi:hypothetical protein
MLFATSDGPMMSKRKDKSPHDWMQLLGTLCAGAAAIFHVSREATGYWQAGALAAGAWLAVLAWANRRPSPESGHAIAIEGELLRLEVPGRGPFDIALDDVRAIVLAKHRTLRHGKHDVFLLSDVDGAPLCMLPIWSEGIDDLIDWASAQPRFDGAAIENAYFDLIVSRPVIPVIVWAILSVPFVLLVMTLEKFSEERLGTGFPGIVLGLLLPFAFYAWYRWKRASARCVVTIVDGTIDVLQGRRSRSLRIDELREVALEVRVVEDSTDHDWILSGSETSEPCRISWLAEGTESLEEWLSALPGFDRTAADGAVDRQEAGRFVCWSRG